MKILIMGATGRCGQQIAHKALANGHEITVFVRNASYLSPEIASKVRVCTTCYYMPFTSITRQLWCPLTHCAN
jgi:nucleoside-diphosphate-sugar epimerase